MSSTPHDAISARVLGCSVGDRAEGALGCSVGEAKGREAAEQAVAAFRPARVFSRLPADRLARKANVSVEAAQALTSMFLQESQEESQSPPEQEKSAQPQSQEEKSAQPQPCQEKPQEKKAEQTAHRSSQQAKGKDQAALYCGSPTCSVSAGVVTSA
jgi:hypothetical protein